MDYRNLPNSIKEYMTKKQQVEHVTKQLTTMRRQCNELMQCAMDDIDHLSVTCFDSNNLVILNDHEPVMKLRVVERKPKKYLSRKKILQYITEFFKTTELTDTTDIPTTLTEYIWKMEDMNLPAPTRVLQCSSISST